MRELKSSELASARGLGVQIRKGDGRAASAPAPGARGSSDPELDWLLGSIRQKRAGRIERERRLGAPPRASVEPSRERPADIERAEPGVVLDVQAVSPSVRIFRVAKPRDLQFRAGQAIKLGLASPSVRRTYSIASSPHDDQLEFCIEAVPGGRFTSQLFELTPGEKISLAPKAKGSLTLQPNRHHHVMVATVTGIAPLRSMLREALYGGQGRAAGQSGAAAGVGSAGASGEFWVLHGASYADELPYADELAALARENARVHYLPTISRPGAARNRGWAGHQGRVESLVMPTLQALPTKADVAVYACGHPEMVRGLREKLSALGYLVLDEAFD
jgi:NAD(P)H-flavin reductase